MSNYWLKFADRSVVGLKFVVREDTDSLVVAANGDSSGVLELWELREKPVSIHRIFQSKQPAATEPAKTVVSAAISEIRCFRAFEIDRNGVTSNPRS